MDLEKKEGEKVEEKVGEGKKVELDSETYEALLDRIAELEASSVTKTRVREEVTDLDTLVEEGKERRRREPEKRESVDLDGMTNTQLAQFVVDVVNEQGGARLNKVEVAVESMRVLREIDKAEGKHEDFWQHEEQIRRIATANPSLSIEDAYKLAKSNESEKKTTKGKGEEEERSTTRTEKLLKLPPRTHGEKPGVAVGSTKEAVGKETLKSAAAKAWDEVVGAGKTTI